MKETAKTFRHTTRAWRELQYLLLSHIGFLKMLEWLKLEPVGWLKYRIDRDKSNLNKEKK